MIASFIGGPPVNCTHSVLRSRPNCLPCASRSFFSSMMVSGRYEMPNCLAMRMVLVCAAAPVQMSANDIATAITGQWVRLKAW